MYTKILRINFNHCKHHFDGMYLPYKRSLERCVLAVFLGIDKLHVKLNNVVFEDIALQDAWEKLRYVSHHEEVVIGLGLNDYRIHFEDIHEQIEAFLSRNYHHQTPVVYVSMYLDPTLHLCVQIRSFPPAMVTPLAMSQ